MKWTLFGGIAGVFIVCAVILVLYLLDDSIKSSDDVEKYLGLSTLALIPVAVDEDSVKKGKTKRKRK